jgi:hypothetical protein
MPNLSSLNEEKTIWVPSGGMSHPLLIFSERRLRVLSRRHHCANAIAMPGLARVHEEL